MRSGSMVIKNGRVLLPNGTLLVSDVLIEGRMIAGVGQGLRAESEIDATGGYILPGLIDLHTHGIEFERTEGGSLKRYAELMASHGATCYPAALFGPAEQSIAAMKRHRQETDELREVPNCLGFRLESPYLAMAGGGLSRDLTPITPSTTAALVEAGGGHIKIWDFSPEVPGAAELIHEFTAQGIVCSLAHTRATIDQARAAVAAGASLVTHLFCTFSVPEMKDPGVYPAGLTDYILTEDRLTAEIIADGTHVSALLVEVAFRCKTPRRLAFVTDANLGAGLPPGEYTIPHDGRRVVVRNVNDGIRGFDVNLALTGSALTPIDMFRNALNLFHKDLPTAVEICARTPARVLGLNKGEIAAGRDADLIVLDEQLELQLTMTAGRILYRRPV